MDFLRDRTRISVAAFTKLGLIDEYRIMINPVVLGEGNPLFKSDKLKLQLLDIKPFGNGNVLLSYSRS